MDTWLMAGAFLVGAALAWGAAQWWFQRKLRAAEQLQDKLEKARQFAAQQASQARKQIEVLQQDIAVLRLAAAKRGLRSESMPVSSASSIATQAEPTAGPPELPGDGFADTQLLAPVKR